MSRALPGDHASPISEWTELLGHLHALANSGRIVRVAVLPSSGSMDDAVLEAEGQLHHMRSDDNGVEWFAVDGEARDEPYFVGGPWTHLQLDPGRFSAGYIETLDDDDYFGISVDFGAVTAVISDSNT